MAPMSKDHTDKKCVPQEHRGAVGLGDGDQGAHGLKGPEGGAQSWGVCRAEPGELSQRGVGPDLGVRGPAPQPRRRGSSVVPWGRRQGGQSSVTLSVLPASARPWSLLSRAFG